jgi:hypothetical protein
LELTIVRTPSPSAVGSLVILALSLTACSGGGHDDATPPVPPVPPVPPAATATASFTSPASVAADVPVVFDGSASTSSNGSDLQYFWDFGDGQLGGGAAIARQFATGGSRSVTLTVIDGAHLSATQTRSLTVTPRPAASSSASIEGFITTVDGVALDAVSVTLVGGAATGTTDALGKVHLTLDLGVPVTLKLAKVGFADQFVIVHIPATAGADGYFEASMRTRDAALSLADAAAGGTLTGRDGAVITLPPNALVDTTNAPVTGVIDIAMTPVDVTQASADGFPGSFDGLTTTGTATPIASYGTVEYVLTVGVERLHLAPGKTATIGIPIYAAVNVDGSPVAVGDTIPLWSLDETTGIWVQEGIGTVVASAASPTGFALSAVVTHFSWWNADIGFDPYGPKPRCVYDTDSGIPGGNDTFATATICNMLAEFDRDPQTAPLSAARAQLTAAALSPRIVGYSRRAQLPIAGGVIVPVPANVDIVLTARALNGTWSGRRVINGAVGVQAEELVPMRPIGGTGPNVETITAPFDDTRALQDGQVARFGFTGTAYRYAHVTVSEGSGSQLAGRVRLLHGATLLGTVDFNAIAGQITALLPSDGEYTIEVSGLTNTPGAYRLQLEMLGGVQTEALALPFDVNTVVPEYFTYHGTFTTATPLTLFLTYAPFGGATGARILAPDASVLLDLPPTAGAARTATVTLPTAGTYAFEAASAAGNAFTLRAAGEQTLWASEAPTFATDSVFALSDLVADHDGKPVIGFTRTFVNGGHSSATLLLRRWTGTAWETVGSDLTIDTPCNTGVKSIGFAFDSNNAPVVAYSSVSPIPGNSSSFVNVLRFIGGAWQPLGPNDGTLPNVSVFGSGCNDLPAVALNAADEPIVAYRVDNNVVLQRFDGTVWTDVTTAGADNFAALGYTFTLNSDTNGRIYFVFASGSFSGVPTRVRRLTTAMPPAWEFVGPNNGALPEIGTLGLGGSTPRLRFDDANSPLIAFVACVGANGTCSSGVAVYRYDGTQWSTTGGYETSPGGYISNSNDLGFTLFNGEAFASWVNSEGNVSAAVVQTNSASGWTPVGDDIGQVPQIWPHALSTNQGYSTRLLATGGELYLASAVRTDSGVQIYLLRKTD